MSPTLPKPLTKNQALVFNALDQADGPLTAYTILNQLRFEGLRSPPQVYRALDKLVQLGLVHRVETINAFMACRHPQCTQNECAIFLICERCDHVAEFSDSSLAKTLNRVAGTSNFEAQNAYVELKGTCEVCLARNDEQGP